MSYLLLMRQVTSTEDTRGAVALFKLAICFAGLLQVYLKHPNALPMDTHNKLSNAAAGALVLWLWESTDNQEVVSSNPNT